MLNGIYLLSVGPAHIRFKGCWLLFLISIQFLLNIQLANSGDSDQTLRSAASDLGLYCLPMSHKKGRRSLMLWLLSGSTGFTCWISFAP